MLSENGRYRIPIHRARPESIRFRCRSEGRNFRVRISQSAPHGLGRVTNTLLVNDIGLHSWEEVDIVTKGGNYGYSQREGNELLIVPGGGKTGTQWNPAGSFPRSDLLTVEGLEKPVAPIYPVAVYSHEEGDAIGSGFVYRGKMMPQMRGKYIFYGHDHRPHFLHRSRGNDCHARRARQAGHDSRNPDHVQEPV